MQEMHRHAKSKAGFRNSCLSKAGAWGSPKPSAWALGWKQSPSALL